MNISKVEIGFRRIRYSEAPDRYLEFGFDYDRTQIVVYIPGAERWERGDAGVGKRATA
jgi:hypothetical protein